MCSIAIIAFFISQIQVMSHILGYPIEVVQAQGPSIVSGDEKNGPKLILRYFF